MATINGLYVFVKDESYSNSVQSVTHPVETGINLTDHVKPEPISLSIKGEIVGNNAESKMNQLRSLMNTGAVITYIGRRTFKNAQIISLNTSHPNTIWGGMEFDAEIREVRVAGSAYKAVKHKARSTKKTSSAGSKQKTKTTKKKRYHTVKKGDCRWSIAQKYKSHGVTIASLTKLNKNRKEIFKSGKAGDWYTLKVGAKMLLGEW